MSLPEGAQAILALRRQGKRPADAIVLSLAGYRGDVGNPQVVIDSPEIDLRWMTELDCFVFTHPSAKEPTAQLLQRLARIAGPFMAVWDVERERGMTVWPVWKGVNRPEIHAHLPASERSDAIFSRWGRARWLGADNYFFARGEPCR